MIKILDIIADRKIYAVYENKYCLARSIDETAPEPFTVWHIDNDGDSVHTGEYFKFGDDAERHFAWLCFDWFSDEQKEPASESEAPEQVDVKVDYISNNSMQINEVMKQISQVKNSFHP